MNYIEGGYIMKNSIRVERAIKRMTQAQLAELIGVSRQTIVAIENTCNLQTENCRRHILLAFDKRVDDIFELEESD